MTEKVVEKVERNTVATVINSILVFCLTGLICLDSYRVYQTAVESSFYDKFILWFSIFVAIICEISLMMLSFISSMTLQGNHSLKTLPYSISFMILFSIKLITLIMNSEGYLRILYIIAQVFLFALVVCQMVAFTLDPHSNSFFRNFRPFKIDVLTIVPLSSKASSLKVPVSKNKNPV